MFVLCVSFLHDSSHGDGIYHGGVPVLDGHFFSHRHRESHVVSGLKIVRCQFVFGSVRTEPNGNAKFGQEIRLENERPHQKTIVTNMYHYNDIVQMQIMRE